MYIRRILMSVIMRTKEKVDAVDSFVTPFVCKNYMNTELCLLLFYLIHTHRWKQRYLSLSMHWHLYVHVFYLFALFNCLIRTVALCHSSMQQCECFSWHTLQYTHTYNAEQKNGQTCDFSHNAPVPSSKHEKCWDTSRKMLTIDDHLHDLLDVLIVIMKSKYNLKRDVVAKGRKWSKCNAIVSFKQNSILALSIALEVSLLLALWYLRKSGEKWISKQSQH